MNRKGTRQQVETAVRPTLTKGEQLRRSGPAWALEQRGKAPLLFRERDLHEVVLTDQRLILLTRPRRRRPLSVGNIVLAKRYSTFKLERARRMRPMLQLRVRTAADRILVLEFRPRDRRVARDLAAELGPAEPRVAHPVQPEPVLAEPESFPENWEEEQSGGEQRSRKDKRRAKKDAKAESKQARPSRKERRRARKAGKKRGGSPEHDDMLEFLRQ